MLFWKKSKKQSKVKTKSGSSSASIQKPTIPSKTKVASATIPKPIPPPLQKSKENITTRPKPSIPRKPKLEPINYQPDPEKEFLRVFKLLTYRHRAWDVWKDFVTMLACAISNAVDKAHYDEREALYMKIIHKYNKQEQMLFPELTAHTIMALDYNPEQDFLGKIFMNLELGDNAKAQIFTPYNVCDLMVKMTMGNVAAQVKKDGYITINDPCCGAGATLIAALNEARVQLEKVGLHFQNHILIVAQDIDETVALMCYIQLSLLGMAAYIKIGNSLTEPMCDSDTMENYWFTPIYFSNVWVMRRIFHGEKL